MEMEALQSYLREYNVEDLILELTEGLLKDKPPYFFSFFVEVKVYPAQSYVNIFLDVCSSGVFLERPRAMLRSIVFFCSCYYHESENLKTSRIFGAKRRKPQSRCVRSVELVFSFSGIRGSTFLGSSRRNAVTVFRGPVGPPVRAVGKLIALWMFQPRISSGISTCCRFFVERKFS